ncbi:cupin [Micromonospora zingiberis]|uniref:Cupin n=1 Tax=Micromonospora zingiberis TaxID=2053011 RepID=A0A4R0GJ37_9ACTN|nr:cupin [Micromonospora zingiberis]TCB97450.1 cupin [Micromonospora zingiberis]
MTDTPLDPQATDQDLVLGPVGQEIVFENDRVRVWHIRLEPGEQQPLHRHDHPYLVVAVHGAKNVIQTVDGIKIDADEPTGGVVYRDPGAVHMLTNVGDTTYLARLVELK